jgi:hypothetical protein
MRKIVEALFKFAWEIVTLMETLGKSIKSEIFTLIIYSFIFSSVMHASRIA